MSLFSEVESARPLEAELVSLAEDFVVDPLLEL